MESNGFYNRNNLYIGPITLRQQHSLPQSPPPTPNFAPPPLHHPQRPDENRGKLAPILNKSHHKRRHSPPNRLTNVRNTRRIAIQRQILLL